jgi:hypothetical protein
MLPAFFLHSGSIHPGFSPPPPRSSPLAPCSVGQRQRTHRVEQRADGVYVQLRLEGSLASDECEALCGPPHTQRCVMAAFAAAPGRVRFAPPPWATAQSLAGCQGRQPTH